MRRVIITGPAKRDIQEAHDWWAEHRSAEQAGRWYVGIRAAILSLRAGGMLSRGRKHAEP
jgi:plasmid stabilization system protein ParE